MDARTIDMLKKDVDDVLSKASLPDGRKVVEEGKKMAEDIQIGRTLFFDKYGVSSEYEYKQKMKKEGRIMYHAHIGFDTWEETASALGKIYNTMDNAGYRLDRYGLCLERGMSLPENLRHTLARETGPRLETEQDWAQLGQAAPIQPHTGDFMIGFPASVENTIHALKAGVTTIGNLSQFFAHDTPGWKDDVGTTVATAKAMAIMAGKRDEGTMVHSYLDDGVAALLKDFSSVAGWALLERYIVEELIGARLADCFGGVAQTPQIRAAWVFALNDIFDGDACGSMYYGDTLSSTANIEKNRTIAAEYLIWDIMAQLKCPIGSAIMPPPFSEGIRIPSVEEIIEVQLFARDMEQIARRLVNYVDFTECYQIKDRIVTGGRRFYKNAMKGLEAAGVNMEDPVQLLYLLKKLGAKLEPYFAAGEEDENAPGGHKAIVKTDVFQSTTEVTESWLENLHKRGLQKAHKGTKVVVASADVHELALFTMRSIFNEFGVESIYLGVEQCAADVANATVGNDVDGIVVSTHNGGALEFAKQLLGELKKVGCTAPVFLGGVLNQGVVGEDLPIDVAEDIRELGITPNADFYDMVRVLDEHRIQAEGGKK